MDSKNSEVASNSPNVSIALFCTHGGSDKEYRIQLEQVEGGFTVTGFNGRRGGALKARPQFETPVTYDVAKKAYDDLLTSKLKSHYVPGDIGSDYVAPANVGTSIGMDLQVLVAVDEADIEAYLTDDRYVAQQKHDGERRPVAVRDEVIGGNKLGFQSSLPKSAIQGFAVLPKDSEFDSEHVGEKFHVFDVLRFDGKDCRPLPYSSRLDIVGLVASKTAAAGNTNIVPVETAYGTEAKRALYAKLRRNREEGMVFKRLDAPYTPGANDDQIKVKFFESATVRVASVNANKRSVNVEVFKSDGQAVPLGTVPIPPNKPVPAEGELVEVKYLYVVSKMVQPVYDRVRTDQTIASCNAAQLKYRADINMDDLETEPAAETEEAPRRRMKVA